MQLSRTTTSWNASLLLIASGILVAYQTTTLADEFLLKDGRAVTGRAVQQGDSNPQWAVEISQGSYVRFAGSEVSHNGRRQPKPDVLAEYLQELAKVESTAESHAALAGWCSRKGLASQAEAHYFRALDFDPDFSTARAALKYSKDNNGRWVKLDELMIGGKGKVKDGAKYVYPEVLAIEAARREAREKNGQWKSKMSRWHREIIAGGNASQKSAAELTQINDPSAIATIGELLLKGKPAATPELKRIYVNLLAQFQSAEAASILADASVFDGDISDDCLDVLRRFGTEIAINRYLNNLKSDNPVYINRAALGLRALNAKNALFPLIEAVVTEHKRVVNPSNTNYNSNGAMTMGSEKAKVVNMPSNNEGVLAALVELTGKNFQYDKPAWIQWYSNIYAAPVEDLRRDP